MPALSVMFKTVSTDCYLDYAYCSYRESLEGTRVRRRLDMWKLGNVLDTPLAALASGVERQAFIGQKAPLPEDCARCEWLRICKSGCPRNRAASRGVPAPDYFCASCKQFFAHGHARLEGLRSIIERRHRYLLLLEIGSSRGTMADRNDPRPCGSGRKLKLCCANSARSRSYLWRARLTP